jgi:hypothetical protein
MSPGGGGESTGALADAIKRDFGGISSTTTHRDPMDKKNFLTDVQTLRKRARQHTDELADLVQDVPSGLRAKPRAAVK